MQDDTYFARLVSLACHDVRTPLATVHGFATTLTRTVELAAPADRYVQMIEQASAQMAEFALAWRPTQDSPPAFGSRIEQFLNAYFCLLSRFSNPIRRPIHYSVFQESNRLCTAHSLSFYVSLRTAYMRR